MIICFWSWLKGAVYPILPYRFCKWNKWWKCNFSPFKEIRTDRPINHPTDRLTNQQTNKQEDMRGHKEVKLNKSCHQLSLKLSQGFHQLCSVCHIYMTYFHRLYFECASYQHRWKNNCCIFFSQMETKLVHCYWCNCQNSHSWLKGLYSCLKYLPWQIQYSVLTVSELCPEITT